ncbi:MAG: hypothetical protein HYX34_04010 [Actinobacteria bacterium]|nr:hypothetical protein [Actinomycetota bacterium]
MIDPVMSSGPDGRPCYTWRPDPNPPTEVFQRAQDAAADAAFLAQAAAAGIAACPGAPPVPTPEAVAVSYFDRSTLPRPRVSTQPPGRGLVAIPVLVQANTPMTWAKTIADTPFGPLTLAATSTITVDWGDGTTADNGPYARPGTTYGQPGTIGHRYADQGRYDITVTQTWTVTWSFGPTRGTIGDLAVTDTIDAFPILQAQARTN